MIDLNIMRQVIALMACFSFGQVFLNYFKGDTFGLGLQSLVCLLMLGLLSILTDWSKGK
jgi:hypothetical protein